MSLAEERMTLFFSVIQVSLFDSLKYGYSKPAIRGKLIEMETGNFQNPKVTDVPISRPRPSFEFSSFICLQWFFIWLSNCSIEWMWCNVGGEFCSRLLIGETELIRDPFFSHGAFQPLILLLIYILMFQTHVWRLATMFLPLYVILWRRLNARDPMYASTFNGPDWFLFLFSAANSFFYWCLLREIDSSPLYVCP